MNFLTAQEKWEALDGLIEVLQDRSFEVSHIDIIRPTEPVGLDDDGMPLAYRDTGVRIYTIVGIMPKTADTTGPFVSEAAEDVTFELEDDLDEPDERELDACELDTHELDKEYQSRRQI